MAKPEDILRCLRQFIVAWSFETLTKDDVMLESTLKEDLGIKHHDDWNAISQFLKEECRVLISPFGVSNAKTVQDIVNLASGGQKVSSEKIVVG